MGRDERELANLRRRVRETARGGEDAVQALFRTVANSKGAAPMAGGKSGAGGAGRYDRIARRPARAASATWEDADADTLWRAVCEVTAAGDALTLSITRDGGAVVLTVLSGDERIRQYAHDAAEIAELLQLVRESVQSD